MATPAHDPSEAMIQLLTEAATDPQRRDAILEGKGMPPGIADEDVDALKSGDSEQIRDALGFSSTGENATSWVID